MVRRGELREAQGKGGANIAVEGKQVGGWIRLSGVCRRGTSHSVVRANMPDLMAPVTDKRAQLPSFYLSVGAAYDGPVDLP